MLKKSVLVVFGKKLPQNKKWLKRFDEVLASEKLANLIKPGSVDEGYIFLEKLANLRLADGSLLPKSVNYRGYELWWARADSLYERFCLPYTQYRDLLFYLKDYKNVYFLNPPYPELFRYFLEARGCQFFVLKKFSLKGLLPLSFGVFLQLLLSLLFLPWLALKRPKVMFWTSDKFAPPHQCDFRTVFIYEELTKRQIQFAEFIRSLEPWRTVLSHAWARKRPVVYSAALADFIYFLAKLAGGKRQFSFRGQNPEEIFWFSAATHYLRNIKGAIWSVLATKFILRLTGVKAAIINVSCSRTFHEVLACKLAGIPTVGIQHGAFARHFFVADFLPGFNGEKMISVDKYGLWSDWWRNYYLKYSRVYKPEQLSVSGLMRPLKRAIVPAESEVKKERLRVLFISEEAAVPAEVLPYLLALLEIEEFDLCLKFRPYRDGFELWLKENRPEIYDKMLKKAKILRGNMEEAIRQCDITIGTHSTAVLEALLQSKPFVFYLTQKWGDPFDIKVAGLRQFFAETPEGLIENIKKSSEITKDELRKLQEQFFGDPFQNGSAWAVGEAVKFL